MKIGLVSDLHLWSRSLYPVIQDKIDVLIVAGDLSPDYTKITQRFEQLRVLYPNVGQFLFVPGNHDFYLPRYSKETRIPSFRDRLREMKVAFEYIPDTKLLYREEIVIEGIKIVGCVGWTDVSGLANAEKICGAINDFHPSVGRFLLEDMKRESDYDLEFLNKTVDSDSIVVTHFSPIVYPHHHWGDGELNRYFCNERLTSVIETKKPKMWCFGHTHSNIMKRVDETLVICNQYGYQGGNATEDVGAPFDPRLNILELI